MQYVMLLWGDEDAWANQDPASAQAAMDDIIGWYERWQSDGKVVDGGAELDTSRKARTIRPAHAGEPVVTDGPYLESKEVIGGILILDADDLDEAVAIAATWPGIRYGDSVEVRPVMQR